MAKKQHNLDRLLTIKEVAHLENTSEKSIQRRIRSGDLPAILYGRQWRIEPRVLQAYRLRKLHG